MLGATRDEWRLVAQPGVVDENVDAAPGVANLFERRRNIGLDREVGAKRHHPFTGFAQLGAQLFQSIETTGARDHAHSLVGQRGNHGATESARAAGDESNPIAPCDGLIRRLNHAPIVSELRWLSSDFGDKLAADLR